MEKIVIIIILASMLIGGCASNTGTSGYAVKITHDDRNTVRIGLMLSECNPGYLPFYIASDNGYFEQENLKSIIVKAKDVADADVTIGGRARYYIYESRTPNHLSIFATTYLNTTNTNYAILVRTDSEATDLKDLAGKSIGLEPTSGMARFFLMRTILEKSGLDPSKFRALLPF